MQFILEYADEEYLIVLSDFYKKESAEIIRISYGENDNDYIEYKVEAFIFKGAEFCKIKVTDLSETLKEIIGKNVQEVLKRTFIANPYFDELLIFAGSEVFTYQEKLKPIECNQCGRINLYEKRNRGNKSEYIANIKKLMESDRNPEWPFNENLLVQFSVSNTQAKLDEVDLDNLAKTIFDLFKGTIYVDDKQITSFVAYKHSVAGLKALMVAIKRLEPGEIPVFQQFLYSGRMSAWQKEYKSKMELNRETRFIVYGTFEANNFEDNYGKT